MITFRKWSKDWNGYMSIEATMIVTWTFFLLIFLIYVSFYMFDRCVAFQDAYALAFRTSVKPLVKEEMQAYGNRNLEAQFGKKYLAVGNMERAIEVKGNQVEADVKLLVNHPFTRIDPTLPQSGWKYSSKVEVQIMNPTKMLREFRRGESLITKVHP